MGQSRKPEKILFFGYRWNVAPVQSERKAPLSRRPRGRIKNGPPSRSPRRQGGRIKNGPPFFLRPSDYSAREILLLCTATKSRGLVSIGRPAKIFGRGARGAAGWAASSGRRAQKKRGRAGRLAAEARKKMSDFRKTWAIFSVANLIFWAERVEVRAVEPSRPCGWHAFPGPVARRGERCPRYYRRAVLSE